MVAEMARIGLVIGQDFDTRPLRSLDPVATESGAEPADVSTAARLADHEDPSGLAHFSQGVGVVEQEVLDTGTLGSLDRKLIRIVPKLALLKMAKRLKDQETTNGWLYFTVGGGKFGTDYLLRGMANLLGPGWNRPEDAVYPLSREDADGNAYDGAAHDYVMRFEAGGLPPVEAFWSLTMYDKDLFFVPNPIDRYTLSARSSGPELRRIGGPHSGGPPAPGRKAVAGAERRSAGAAMYGPRRSRRRCGRLVGAPPVRKCNEPRKAAGAGSSPAMPGRQLRREARMTRVPVHHGVIVATLVIVGGLVFQG
jgi:hypothetical protein